MIELQHFKPHEFRGWFDAMNPDLLERLDRFRRLLDAPVMVSPAAGALGRHLGPDSNSQHNVDVWDEVRAVDVMPHLPIEEMSRAFDLAVEAGFTGIGLYPDWRPQWGMHLDVRADRCIDDPALWSGLRINGRQEYRSIDEAFA